MRITENEKDVIIEAVKSVDPAAQVWLFGSRADDNKKGGDIDIAIYSEKINHDVMQEIKVRRFICNKIGEQKIDIVTSSDGKEAFFRLAVAEGIKLK
jgi:predicted nucleotidyltransferase